MTLRSLTCWLLVVVAGGACEPLPERSVPARRAAPKAPKSFAPPQGFTQLRLGVIPSLATDTLRKSYARFGEYLQRQLSVPVHILVPDTYADAINKVKAGEYDLVSLSPYAYTQATDEVKLNCLVQSIADGSATASGYVFVRDDSPRRSIEELVGARFGFVDPDSTSGYLYPMKLLRDRKFNPVTLASTEFLGNHEAVLLAVLEGRVDVGATYQGAFAALRRARGVDPRSFRVIAKTQRMPRDIFCLRRDVPLEVGEAISRALLALSGSERAGREILGPLEINGFTPADDAAYDDVRKVAREVPHAPRSAPAVDAGSP